MRERQLPSEEDDPKDVADDRGRAGTVAAHDPAAEWPQREAGDPEAREPERNRDDQDEGQDPEERI
jgi:hypothetical protein